MARSCRCIQRARESVQKDNTDCERGQVFARTSQLKMRNCIQALVVTVEHLSNQLLACCFLSFDLEHVYIYVKKQNKTGGGGGGGGVYCLSIRWISYILYCFIFIMIPIGWPHHIFNANREAGDFSEKIPPVTWAVALKTALCLVKSLCGVVSTACSSQYPFPKVQE